MLRFEFVGYSPKFRELRQGEVIPEYSLEISFFGDDASVTVTERTGVDAQASVLVIA